MRFRKGLLAGLLVPMACAGIGDRTYEVTEPADLGVDHLASEAVDSMLAGRQPLPEYSSMPATSGPHAGAPTACGVFREEVLEIFNIHSLEHGAVIFYYQPDLVSDGERAELEDLARELATHVIVMPYAALEVPMAMVAWGHLAELDRVDLEAARSFWGEFAQRGPESGIRCDFTVDEAV